MTTLDTPPPDHNRPPLNLRVCKCLERGGGFETAKQWGIFCSTACRTRFNNRRAMRGAMLYDLFMVIRFERGIAKAKGAWTLACALAHHYHEEDVAQRGGRKSWRSVDAVLVDAPWLLAKSSRLR